MMPNDLDKIMTIEPMAQIAIANHPQPIHKDDDIWVEFLVEDDKFFMYVYPAPPEGKESYATGSEPFPAKVVAACKLAFRDGKWEHIPDIPMIVFEAPRPTMILPEGLATMLVQKIVKAIK